MITQSNVWLYMKPGRRIDYSKLTGKWLCFGKKEKIHGYIDEINSLAERGIFRAAKISRKLPEHDHFPNKSCVLCVYTSSDEKEKEAVQKKLKSMGLWPAKWKSKEETGKDWEKGGKLYKEFIQNKGETRE